jgi:hypothetical protein
MIAYGFLGMMNLSIYSRMIPLTLVAVMTASCGPQADWADRPVELEPGKVPWEQLLRDYQAWGLPMPPKDAQLVCCARDGNIKILRQDGLPVRHLGFLLPSRGDGRPRGIIVGTVTTDANEVPVIGPAGGQGGAPRAEPSEVPLDQVEKTFRLVYDNHFAFNAFLATAIQCKYRGWDGLAHRLLASSLSGYRHIEYPDTIRRELASLAWSHWAGKLTRPESDWRRIAKHLKAIRKDAGLPVTADRSLLESLYESLATQPAPPGSIDEMINDLMLAPQPRPGPPWEDVRYERLAAQGFAAVPALIEHLDDDRLTRRTYVFFVMTGPPRDPHILRVGNVVHSLIRDIAGCAPGQDNLWPVTKADAMAWWETAREAPKKQANQGVAR